MNKIINKVFPVIVLAFVLTLSSCLSDSDYADNWIGTKKTQDQNFVEVHLTSSENSNLVSRAYPVIGRDTTITKFIPINLTSGPAASDVTITYERLDTLNSAIVDSLVNIDGLILADASKITDLNQDSKVVIPAGSSTGYIAVKLNPDNLIGSTYLFGIKITSISDPKYTLSNLSTGIIKFGAANDYDGEYINEGTFVDVTNANFKAAYPLTVHLVTQDATSVAYFDVDIWGDFFHAFMNGTSYSGYGSFAPVFKFDENDNVISVVNYYGQPAGNGRSAELDPSGVNKFDRSTRTLKVKYWMNQPGAAHRTYFDETFTYVGPR
ncbi:MAG TPA: DUF1735 domain-containing protein [Paludibacter sp.]